MLSSLTGGIYNVHSANASQIYDTLVLDQGYQPLHVIPWQKAFCMGLTQRVEVLCAHQRLIKTVDCEYPAPAVIRLLGPRRNQQYQVRFSRSGIYRRDAFTCQYCGRRLRRDQCTIDHVIARHLGGPTTWQNVVTACRPCNFAKGGKRLEDTRMTLLKMPVRPRWLPLERERFGSVIPEAWRDWLGAAS